jgi:hypothetical protein
MYAALKDREDAPRLAKCKDCCREYQRERALKKKVESLIASGDELTIELTLRRIEKENEALRLMLENARTEAILREGDIKYGPPPVD